MAHGSNLLDSIILVVRQNCHAQGRIPTVAAEAEFYHIPLAAVGRGLHFWHSDGMLCCIGAEPSRT